MKRDQLASAIQLVLMDGAADGPLGGLMALVVDGVLAQPVGALLDAGFVADQIIACLSGPGPARLVDEHLDPAVAMERERVEASGETLGDALPPDVVAAAEERLGRPSGLPEGIWDGVVEPSDVRELLAAALADTMEDILARLGFGGGAAGAGAGAGGLFGTLARGAKAVRSTGSGFLGAALGGAFQEGVQRQIRTLAAQSATALKERLRERLRTPEGQAVAARIRRRAVERLLALPLADAYRVADDPGIATMGGLALGVLARNIARPAVQDAVRAQVRSALARVGDRTARTLLDEQGLLPAVRDEVVARGIVRAAPIVSSNDFRDWLTALLARAEDVGVAASGSGSTAAAKKAAPRKTATKKPAPKKTAANKPAPKKTAASKTAASKTAAGKTAAGKTAAKDNKE